MSGQVFVKANFNELNKFGKRVGNRASTKEYFSNITDELGEKLTANLIANTPVGETGELKKGWEGTKPRVYVNKKGYSISIKNKCPYAEYVNYGHPSFNQYNVGGDPYVVNNRIKVPVADPRQQGDETHWVFGHFFIEKTLDQLMAFGFATSDKKVRRQLQKWFGYCVNGK